MRHDYHERRANRQEAYERLAEKNAAESERRANSENLRTLHSMAGEPIKIGHHSEKRHRRLIERAHNDIDKSIEADRKAKHYRTRAKELDREPRAISSDDPEAVEKLRAKIDQAERFAEAVKAANKIVRRKPKNEATAEKIAELCRLLNWSQAKAAQLFEPDFCGRIGFPSYALDNNRANLRRMQKRLAELERQEQARSQVDNPEAAAEYRLGCATVTENLEANRLQLRFDDIPPKEQRQALKAAGFRWCRSEQAWQRHLNNAARYAAKRALGVPVTA